MAGLPVTLLWVGNDWRLVLQPDGSFNGGAAPVWAGPSLRREVSDCGARMGGGR